LWCGQPIHRYTKPCSLAATAEPRIDKFNKKFFNFLEGGEHLPNNGSILDFNQWSEIALES